MGEEEGAKNESYGSELLEEAALAAKVGDQSGFQEKWTTFPN